MRAADAINKRSGATASDAVAGLGAEHGHILEAVNDDGSPYRSPVLACERGLTMAASQYLELVGS